MTLDDLDLSLPIPAAAIKWTDEQEAVFSCVGNQHLMIQARAGSSKTTVLVQSVLRLTSRRPQDTILLLAFNVKIKDELISELYQKLSGNKKANLKLMSDWLYQRKITVLTMNGLGHRAWAKFLGRQPTLESGKLGDIVSEICQANDTRSTWAATRQLASAMRANGLVPRNAPRPLRYLIPDEDGTIEDLADHYDIDNVTPVVIAQAREAVTTCIKQAYNGLIDFDDQIFMPVCYGAPFPTFNQVMVDEAQDLSAIQHIMVEKALGLSGVLTAVGDDRQAVYGFRGAAADSMDRFAQKFKPKVLPLTVCFRCGEAIVKHAAELVPDIRHFKAGGEVHYLEKWDDSIFLQGDVVLCRNNAPLIATAFRLIKQGISCYMIGRDIGKGLVSLITKLSNDNSSMPLERLMSNLTTWERTEIRNAQDKHDSAKEHKARDKAECIRACVEFSGALNIDSLVNHINNLFNREAGKVTLSSVHKFKGLEAKRVFILDASLFGKYASSDWAMTQEDNLLYVARTRAQLSLFYIESENYVSKDDRDKSNAVQKRGEGNSEISAPDQRAPSGTGPNDPSANNSVS